MNGEENKTFVFAFLMLISRLKQIDCFRVIELKIIKYLMKINFSLIHTRRRLKTFKNKNLNSNLWSTVFEWQSLLEVYI